METGFRQAAHEAPDAPRGLTPDMENDAEPSGRMLRIFGTIWTSIGLGVFVPSVLLGLAGVPAWVIPAAIAAAVVCVGLSLRGLGRWSRARELSVYRDGAEARGEIVRVEKNTNVRLNERHPWRIVYRFTTPEGREVESSTASWLDEPDIEPSTPVTVLYDSKSPRRSVLWTRLLERDKAAPRIARVRVAPTVASSAETPSRVRVAAEAESVPDAEESELVDEEKARVRGSQRS